MVAVAETLTPATARGAFLMMQIERERERAALHAREGQRRPGQAGKGRHLPAARERAPAQRRADRAFRRQRALLPGSGAPDRARRSGARRDRSARCRRQLLDRAATAASAGNAAETERWLANADSAGAPRQEMTTIRRALQDTLIGARAGRMTALTQSFTDALGRRSGCCSRRTTAPRPICSR